jgi:hypothetical protein
MHYPTLDETLSSKTLTRWFVGLNLFLLAVFGLQASDAVPELFRFVPGEFHNGFHSSGTWLYLAMAVLANVLAVMALGFVVIFPSLLDGVGVDERRVAKLLTENAVISREALDACLAVVHAEAVAARRRIAVGRAIIVAAAVAMVFAFTMVCFALVDAPPRKALFTNGQHIILNTDVTGSDLWRFTGDQIAGAIALDIPELYDFHFGTLENNVDSHIFTNFVFGFRALLGWVALTSIIVTIRDWRSRPPKNGV